MSESETERDGRPRQRHRTRESRSEDWPGKDFAGPLWQSLRHADRCADTSARPASTLLIVHNVLPVAKHIIVEQQPATDRKSHKSTHTFRNI